MQVEEEKGYERWISTSGGNGLGLAMPAGSLDSWVPILAAPRSESRMGQRWLRPRTLTLLSLPRMRNPS